MTRSRKAAIGGGIPKAYGRRGSKLAISRLKEAVAEIKSVAKIDAAAAGEGAISLMERIWPAFQDIDTSSGALGTAVYRSLEEIVPLLVNSSADHGTTSKWLERLFTAVQNDGVEYLGPLEERWGEIARYPDLINAYADRLLPLLARAWADHGRFSHVTGTTICLSCLLEAGRCTELYELLAKPRLRFWPYHRFGAEALVRQGLLEAAIAYAEAARSSTHHDNFGTQIDRFCETVLIGQGRSDEAYRTYGLRAASGTTNLAVYRSLAATYPHRDRKPMLQDLIANRGDRGKWFAAAKDAGFLDLALECAAHPGADPSTLVRAARDFGAGCRAAGDQQPSRGWRLRPHDHRHARCGSILHGSGMPSGSNWMGCARTWQACRRPLQTVQGVIPARPQSGDKEPRQRRGGLLKRCSLIACRRMAMRAQFRASKNESPQHHCHQWEGPRIIGRSGIAKHRSHK